MKTEQAKQIVKDQTKDFFNIFRMIKTRKFEGNTGLAVKNSFFNLATNVTGKIGSLLFTIIIARLLLPELFGLYSLALSTIVLIGVFADLGMGTAIIRYLSKEKGDNGGYYHYFFKLKLILTFAISFIMFVLAYFISNFYYHKPIFYALLAGSLYILITNLSSFYSSVFQSKNNFKPYFIKEIIFQISRLIIVPLGIILFINNSEELFVFIIILLISFSYLISFIYMAYKNNPPLKEKINKAEKRKILFFLAPISATVLSGLFFGYIDIIMLGRFVDSEYLGYYQAALALIGSAGAFVGFMSAAIFPLFSQLKGRQLTTLFNKSMKYTMIFSLIGVVGTLVFSKLIITLIYGPRYLLSIPLLNLFSFILVLDPLIGLYSSFFISQDKQNFIAKIFLFSTILNIILNYFFITLFLKNGSYFATIGAAIATIISKSICLSILSFKK